MNDSVVLSVVPRDESVGDCPARCHLLQWISINKEHPKEDEDGACLAAQQVTVESGCMGNISLVPGKHRLAHPTDHTVSKSANLGIGQVQSYILIITN